MPARGKISLDSSEYKKKLDEVKKSTKDATDDMSKSVSGFGRSIDNAGKIVGSFASDIGSKFGAAGKVIGALASGPVAALAAALGALVAIGLDVWDKMTLSAEEYAAKLEASISLEEKRLSKMKEEAEREDKYIERLKELAKNENLSNEEKEEATFLLNTLTSKYGSLGIEIDKATGKINGLAEAEQKLNQVQKDQMIKSLENQLKNKSILSERSAEDLLVGSYAQQFADAFTFGDNAGRRRKRNYQSMTIEQKLAFAQDMVAPGGRAKSDAEIQAWTKIAQSLQEQIDLQNQLNNLRENDAATTEEKAKNLESASRTERKAIEDEENAWNSFNESRIKAEDEWLKKAEETAKKELDIERKKDEKKKQYFENTLVSLRDAALRASGRGRQADIEAAVRSAEQANGGEKLSPEDYARTVNIAKARYALSHMQTGAQALDYAPRVNSLVARGGSATPVKMPKIEELQSKSLRTQESINKTASAILKKVDEWALI